MHSAAPATRDLVAQALSAHGLILRGGFDFTDGDDRPAGPSGEPASAVLLVGSSGSGWWRHFQAWRALRPEGEAHPLDSWAREVAGRVAADAGAQLLMPSDRPYAPFQQWAMRAEGLRPSPLGLLMHPDYGLWHAYRAALLFDVPFGQEPDQHADKPIHLCDACVGKACLKACPVDAHSTDGFAYHRCLDHVRGPLGWPCRDGGCLDRNACPYGAGWRYPAEVQAFFQRAFAGLA